MRSNNVKGTIKKNLIAKRRKRQRGIVLSVSGLIIAAMISTIAYSQRPVKEEEVYEAKEEVVEETPTEQKELDSEYTNVKNVDCSSYVKGPVSGATADIYGTVNFHLTNLHIMQNKIDTVMSANTDPTADDFLTWVTGFNDWVYSNKQVVIDFTHSFEKDGATYNLCDYHSQYDNATTIQHATYTQPKYQMDQWYDKSLDLGFINISTENDTSNWTTFKKQNCPYFVDLVDSASDIESLSKLLMYIASTGEFTTYDGIKDNNFLVSYSGGSNYYEDCRPAFAETCTVYDWTVSIQKFDDRVDIVLDYTFSEDSAITSEKIVYSVTPTDTYTIEYPNSIVESATPDLSALEKIINNVR